MTTAAAVATSDVYVDAIRASALFASSVYQRDLDPRRVKKMCAEFDRRMVGVLEVSDRGDGTYAILDGQHRHAAVIEVGAEGRDTPVVCQVYTGLSVADEARLFHEINNRRKSLSFWDKWKARRASGDERVALIEQVLANHGLKVDPAPRDGNVAASGSLELIVDKIGDAALLDNVVGVLLSAFGRSRDAFTANLMTGLAHVLTSYDPDEIDLDRLVTQLSDIPPRQITARAYAARDVHGGRIPRLFAGVIVEQYNRGPGRKLESYFARVPRQANGLPRRRANAPAPTIPLESFVAHQVTREAEASVRLDGETHVVDLAEVNPGEIAESGPSLFDKMREYERQHRPATSPLMAVCGCGHTQRRHEDQDGICLVGECECTAYTGGAS